MQRGVFKRAFAISVFACFAVTACSLVTDFDGFTGRTSSGSQDGSVVGDGASAIDGSLPADATTSDGPPTGLDDASADAACSASMFCDNFDDGDLTRWTRRSGTVELDTTQSVSPPRSVRTTASAARRSASLEYDHAQGAERRVLYDFDVHTTVSGLATSGDEAYCILGAIYIGTVSIRLVFRAAGLTLDYCSSGCDGNPLGLKSPGWHHVHLELAPNGWIGIVDGDQRQGTTTPLPGGQTSISAGLYCGSSVPEVTIYIDNVRVEWR